MGGEPKVTVHGDAVFQRREWRVERGAWALAAVLIALALLGLFGAGPLSWTGAGSPDGLVHAEYERFTRERGPTTLEVRIAPEAAQQGRIRLGVSQDYLEAFMVQSITPQPSTVVGGTDTLVYEFEVDRPDTPLTVTFNLQGEQMWLHQGELGVEGSAPVRFRQFVYP
ncbi:hypothetical protein NI17_008590 [Thermobifida halotolerans]|uniref:Uncharacterized protein n=1 Tax=Thermobifida halotolerans TaxID=483545 RepID=A0AA97M5P7_9ACTN|nr:hypothetical protein [Thermobifida halotolerans]UOE21182.1 hypothetical protein NI17_008590 [Thermobifida halotolerans]